MFPLFVFKTLNQAQYWKDKWCSIPLKIFKCSYIKAKKSNFTQLFHNFNFDFADSVTLLEEVK